MDVRYCLHRPSCAWALAWVASFAFWAGPSKGTATAVCLGVFIYALFHGATFRRAWFHRTGLSFLLLGLVPIASLGWSISPEGTQRDLVKIIPMVMGVLALPTVATSRQRIWRGLLLSAACVTLLLAIELGRLVGHFGFTRALLEQARYLHPYLYTHPNVSSMMACLSALILGGYCCSHVLRPQTQLRRARRGYWAVCGLGLLIDLLYVWVMGSRGPQAVFAMTVLAAPILFLPGWRARVLALCAAGLLAVGMWNAMGILNPRFEDAVTMRRFNDREIVWNHTNRLLQQSQKTLCGFGYGKKAFKKAYYENPICRAPYVRDGNLVFPHAHGYWRMVRFEGGLVGLVLCVLAWGQLALLAAQKLWREGRSWASAVPWRVRFQQRCLGAVLLSALGCILVYGFWDYPDHAIRHAQFFLMALIMAWSRLTDEN